MLSIFQSLKRGEGLESISRLISTTLLTCSVSIHEDLYVILPFVVHKHLSIFLRVISILKVRADALRYGKPDVIWSQMEMMMSRVSYADGSKQAALELPSFTDHLSLGTVKNFLIVIPLVPSASQSQVIAQAVNRYLPFNVRGAVRLSTITFCVLLQSPGCYMRCQKLCAACMRYLLWILSKLRFPKKTDQIAHSKEPLTIPGRAVGSIKVVLHKERVLGFTFEQLHFSPSPLDPRQNSGHLIRTSPFCYEPGAVASHGLFDTDLLERPRMSL
jgi:hypothetical protein